MSKEATQLLVHIGPVREESQHILQTAALPTLIATLDKKPSRLEALHNSLPELYIAECPISAEGGEAMLYEYNIAELSSLAPASGLTMLYPGLTEKQHRTVDTHTLEVALKAHQLSDMPVTQLIIEQPEAAQRLLNTLEAKGQLHALKKLWVRTSPESLYAEMPTQTELLAACEQLGFEVVNTQVDDPDFPLVEFKRNPFYHAHKQLQHKTAKLEQQQKEQAATKETVQAETAQLKKEREKLTRQHAEQTKALDTAKHELNELKQQRDQLKKASDEQAAAKEKAQAETAKLKQEREKLTKQQETLREQLREQQQKNQTLEAEMQATQTRQNKLTIELERAEAQLELIKELLLKDKLLQS
ncbi:MAG: hypothetical protein GYB28_11805 [Gammaproteobacteria bacterium]|nr:hypothetical protein [Gammaproteobacteria bacterium]